MNYYYFCVIIQCFCDVSQGKDIKVPVIGLLMGSLVSVLLFSSFVH